MFDLKSNVCINIETILRQISYIRMQLEHYGHIIVQMIYSSVRCFHYFVRKNLF
jgi:hypothetical protein